MSNLIRIITDEWRYWARSRLGVVIVIAGLALTVVSAVLSVNDMVAAGHHRTHMQAEADARFYQQPDRHPHRMVHYGHYAFRIPPPLSIVDPGLDAITGSTIFLEGHRQNSAMFAERKSKANLAIFESFTPAFVVQKLAPLLLILLGYNVISRERETRAFDQMVAQGIPPTRILAAKGFALAAAAGLMLVPLAVAAIISIGRGESTAVVALFVTGYALYLGIWCALIVSVSTLARSRSTSLGILLALWTFLSLLLPPLSSSIASSSVNMPGKIETDFAVITAKQKVGDGHNAADPAFLDLKGKLLQQYQVESVEQLPMNFRGVVAGVAETELTEILNRFAEQRMQFEIGQSHVARAFGWLSPVLSVREFSMTLAGVDLETHHRFLRETEKLRFNFVQSLNELQAQKLTYLDDINRSRDAESEKRTRIDAQNWALLNEFRFEVAPSEERIAATFAPLLKLLIWFTIAIGLCANFARRSI